MQRNWRGCQLGGVGGCAFLILMSFTYSFGANGQPDQVRLLIADTDSAHPIFQDSEIQVALTLESSQNLFVSGMATSGGTPTPPQINVSSSLRAAAMLLDSLAANKSRLAGVIALLDVKLSIKDAAIQLRATAKDYRETEANQAHFAIAELVVDQFTARERVWKQLLRIEGGA